MHSSGSLSVLLPQFCSKASPVPRATAQAASIVELHQQLREIIEDHCSSVPAVRSIQMARGLVATPYPLCNMLPAMHYRAPEQPSNIWVKDRINVGFRSGRRQGYPTGSIKLGLLTQIEKRLRQHLAADA